MKSAEEWNQEIMANHKRDERNSNNYRIIKQIQLDAMREGMRRAVKCCFDVQTNRMLTKHNIDGALDCQKSIESASNQLTIGDAYEQ